MQCEEWCGHPAEYCDCKKGAEVGVSETARCSTPTEFVMAIELHEPDNKNRPCEYCVLSKGFMCMDRSYCQLDKNRAGKVWRKKA